MTRFDRFPTDQSGSGSPPLVPVVPVHGRIPDQIDARLTSLAGDPGAATPEIRNALLAAYWPVLQRICRRVWRQWAERGLVDLEDVEHEGVLLFYALLERWPGSGSFSRYLLGRFRWRLIDQTRRLTRKPSSEQLELALIDDADDSYQAELALRLLDELLEPLSPFDRSLVSARVLDKRSFPAIARTLGVSTSSIEKRWRVLRIDLYRNLQLLLKNIE